MASATTTSIVSLPNDTTASAVGEILRRDGVVIIESLFDSALMDNIMSELQPHLAATEPGGGSWFGRRSKRVSGLVAKAHSFHKVITDPTMLAVGKAVLSSNCHRFQLQLSAALEVWPGGTLQPLHRDDGTYAPYLVPAPDKELMLSFMVAATDFTAANGGTRFLVGSHAGAVAPEAGDEALTVQAEMPKGSVALWLGSTLHGMSINTTDAPRAGLVSAYAVGWLRQEENQYLTVPPDVASGFPDDVARLLGYAAYSPILGWAGDRDSSLQTRVGQRDDSADFLETLTVASGSGTSA
jgi:ectoine hydroxylase-related dioxygenase (phytanoyl-CoA dioxygenase family)